MRVAQHCVAARFICKSYYFTNLATHCDMAADRACSKLMRIQSLLGQPLLGSTAQAALGAHRHIAQLSTLDNTTNLPSYLPINLLKSHKCINRG